MRKHEILTRPTRPLTIDGRKNVAGLLEKMQGISFQGRNLATAYHVWKKMLQDRVMIMMGVAGAMVPAGMRRPIVYLIKNRPIHFPVSTRAPFFPQIPQDLGGLPTQIFPPTLDVAF